MLIKLPIHAEKFSDHGPVLFFGEVPYAWGWKANTELSEDQLAFLDKFGKWHTKDGDNVLVNKFATVEQLEVELTPAKFVVLDKVGKFVLAVYGDDTIVRDERYDPRKIRKTLELSEDEYERQKD